MEKPLSCRPSAFYFRQEIRNSGTRDELEELALHLVREHEELREWVRAHGLIPPRWFITPSERLAKPEGLVFQFPSTEP